jgi:hypothetical protein
MTSYMTVILPLVWVLAYWMKIGIDLLSKRYDVNGKVIKLLALFIAVGALVTNHLWISYPSIFNQSRHSMVDPKVALPLSNGKPYFNHLFREYPASMLLSANNTGNKNGALLSEENFISDEQLVLYYRKASDFSQDALMISRLTSPWQKVPVISSFETKILMQSNRKPYFYYFPLMISRPMDMSSWAAVSIYTKTQLRKVLLGLEKDKPEFIFIERIFLLNQVPQAYAFQYPALIELLRYVNQYYQIHEQGKYLVALRRKTL